MEKKRQLHNSKIREMWNRHYNQLDAQIEKAGLQPGTPEYKTFVRNYLRAAAAEIDYLLGQFFSEYRQTLVWQLGMLPKDKASMK